MTWLQADRPGALPRPVRRVLRHAARAHGGSWSSRSRRRSSRRWLQDQRAPGRRRPRTTRARRGAELFLDRGCARCHAMRGTPALRAGGPGSHPRRQPPDARRGHARRTCRATSPAGSPIRRRSSPATACRASRCRADDFHALVALPRRASADAGRRLPAPDRGAPGGVRARSGATRAARSGSLRTIQNIPIAHRYMVDGLRVLPGRRRPGAAAARSSSARPENTFLDAADLQPALHDARHDDDVPLRHPVHRGARHLHAAADARHAGPALPPPDRAELLDLPLRRALPLLELPRSALAPDGGWFAYVPLTGKTYSPGLGMDFWDIGLSVAEVAAMGAAAELIVGILRMRAPGMSLDPAAAVRLGDAGDRRHDHLRLHAADRRHRACSSWTGRASRASSIPRRAASRCSGSTSSGCSATPRCTSCSCRPSASCRRSCRPSPAGRWSATRLMVLVDGGHGLPQLRAVGPPHVHDRPVAAGARLLHGGEPGDRRPERRAGDRLDRDPVDRAARCGARRCSSWRASSRSSSWAGSPA